MFGFAIALTPGPWQPLPEGEEMRLLSYLEALPLASQLRVPQDLTFQLYEDPKSISKESAYVVQCWAAAYQAMLESWRFHWAPLTEMVRLLRLGEKSLKQLLGTRALESLLRPPPFLLFLLQALHLQPVLHVDVKAFVEQRLKAFWRHMPRAWRGPQVPPLDLHPLPMDDGVSNAQRAKRIPFCLDVMLFATPPGLSNSVESLDFGWRLVVFALDFLVLLEVWHVGEAGDGRPASARAAVGGRGERRRLQRLDMKSHLSSNTWLFYVLNRYK